MLVPRLTPRQPFAQLGQLSAAHGQRLRFAAQPQSVAIFTRTLERLDVRDGDEQAAMRTHEVLREFFFELLQRLVDEILAAPVAHGDVLPIRAKVTNVLYRNKLQLVAHSYGHVLPRHERLRGRAEATQLRRAQA